MLIHHTDCGMLDLQRLGVRAGTREGGRPAAEAPPATISDLEGSVRELDPAHQGKPLHPQEG